MPSSKSNNFKIKATNNRDTYSTTMMDDRTGCRLHNDFGTVLSVLGYSDAVPEDARNTYSMGDKSHHYSCL